MIFNMNHSVEKDGTGIEAREADSNHFTVWIRAHIAQDVYVEQGSSGCQATAVYLTQGKISKSVWH